MKKLLLLSLLFAGCNSGVMSADEELEKKVMCAVYKDEAETVISGYNFEHENGENTLFLEEMFYSPTENSCLFSATGTSFMENQLLMLWNYKIFDALSSEVLYSDYGCDDEERCYYSEVEAQALFRGEVSKYKGLSE